MNKYSMIDLKPLYELDHKMEEIKKERDLHIADLETKSREELVSELLVYREISPHIVSMMDDLSKFRVLAPDAETLNASIEIMVQRYSGTIAMQARQIDEMRMFIDKIKEDPLGIDDRLGSPNTKVTIQ